MGNYWTNADGLPVHFGERYSGEQSAVGEGAAPSGNRKTLTVLVNIRDFTAGTATYNGPTVVLPAGAVIKSVSAETIVAAGAMGGTTPTIAFGKVGSITADHAGQLSNAQAQAVAPYDVTATQAGVFAAATPLLVATTCTVGLGGTTPTVHATNRAGTFQFMIAYEDPLGVAG